VAVGRDVVESGNTQDKVTVEHAHVPSCIELNYTKNREGNGR
jgi:hypothetical protein